MPRTREVDDDAAKSCHVHLLDVGTREYGDCALLVFGKSNRTTVLIDGGHPGDYKSNDPDYPSIPTQISEVLGTEKASIDLLIVSHAHQDHIGCIPRLVEDGYLRAKWALVADPGLGWGRTSEEDADPDSTIDVDDPDYRYRAALREERPSRMTDAQLDEFIEDAAKLEPTYRALIENLKAAGTEVRRRGRDDESDLVEAFSKIGMQIYGPSQDLVLQLAEKISGIGRDSVADAEVALDSPRSVIEAFKALLATSPDNWKKKSVGPSINCQSSVVSFNYGAKLLFSGDMQFADPELFDDDLSAGVRALWKKAAADGPFDFVKIGHHASYNAFDETIFADLGETNRFGIMNGVRDDDHPHRDVLALLRKNRQRIKWARTDRNGHSTLSFPSGEFEVARGRVNDSRENIIDAAIVPTTPATVIPSVPVPAPEPVVVRGGEAFVELTAKIPVSAGSVTISVNFDRAGGAVVDRPFRTEK